MVKDLNVKTEIICWKIKQVILENTGIGKDFLNKTPMAQEIILRINKRGQGKLKSFCIARETTNRVQRHPLE